MIEILTRQSKQCEFWIYRLDQFFLEIVDVDNFVKKNFDFYKTIQNHYLTAKTCFAHSLGFILNIYFVVEVIIPKPVPPPRYIWE